METIQELSDQACGDLRMLANESCEFEEGNNFSEIWDENPGKPFDPEEFLMQSAFGQKEHPNKGVILSQEIEKLDFTGTFDKEHLISLLQLVEAQVTVIQSQIISVHDIIFRMLFENSFSLVDVMFSFYEKHIEAFGKLGGDNLLSKFQTLALKNLGIKGLQAVEKFTSFSTLFHSSLRDKLNMFKVEQFSMYQKFSQDVNFHLSEECRTLGILIMTLRAELNLFIENPQSKSNRPQEIKQILKEGYSKALATVNFLHSESTRVIRMSFEFVEVTIDLMNSVLKEIKVMCDEVEFSEMDSNSSMRNSKDEDSILRQLDRYFLLDESVRKNINEGNFNLLLPSEFEIDCSKDHKWLNKKIADSLLAWYDNYSCYAILSGEQNKNETDLFCSENQVLVDKFGRDLISAVYFTPKDLFIIESQSYNARVNKGNIPVNGTFGLLEDFVLFHGTTLGTLMNLMIPYTMIIGVTPVSNFFNHNNGIKIHISGGSFEIFFKDEQVRLEVIKQISFRKDSIDSTLRSPLGRELSFRDEFYWETQGRYSPLERKFIPEECLLEAHRKVKIVRRAINLRNISIQLLDEGVTIDEINLHRLLHLLFLGTGINQPKDALIEKWKSEKEQNIIDQIIPYSTPAFLREGTSRGSDNSIFQRIQTINLFRRVHQQRRDQIYRKYFNSLQSP
jgi:hypothetical protein